MESSIKHLTYEIFLIFNYKQKIQVHSNPIIITFCSLLYYKDLSDHIRNHRIEKIEKGLDESIEKNYTLKPSNFNKRPLNEFNVHPFVVKKSNLHQPMRSYNRKILNRWHLFLRLSINIELTSCRKHRMKKSMNDSKSPALNNVILMMNRLKNEIIDKRSKFNTDKTVLETQF
jgi:hypothetical protein